MASRKIEVQIVGDASGVKRAFGDATSASSSLGRNIGTLGKAIGVAFVASTAAAGLGIKKMIGDASDLNEQINKSQVVFGKSGDEVVKWSKNLATNFGVSSQAALEAAGTFGNMLVPMGFGRDRAAEMSQKMVELAGDMSSFNNASPADTLEAIRAGLAGEAEPLRKFGVFLSDARLKQEALNLGLYKGKGVLDANAKAQATYALILKDTKDAQGDFARTNTGLANSQRVVAASIDNISAKLGTALLPVIAKGTTAFASFLTKFDEAKGAEAKFKVVVDAVKNLAGEIAAALGNLARNIDWGKVWSNISGMTAGLVKALEKAWSGVDMGTIASRNTSGAGMSGGLQKMLTDAIANIDWGAVGQTIANGFRSALNLGKEMVDAINNGMDSVNWEAVGKRLGPALAAMVVSAFATLIDPGFWLRNWDLALAVASVAFGGAIGKLAGTLGKLIGSTLSRAFETGVLEVSAVVARISPRIGIALLSGLERIPGLVGGVFERTWSLAKGVLDRMFSFIEGLFPRLGKVATFAIKVLGIDVAIRQIANLATQIAGKVADWAAAGLKLGKAAIDGIWNGMKSAWNNVLSWLLGLPGRIFDAVGDLSGLLFSAGVDVVMGFVHGIESKFTALSQKGAELADRIKHATLGTLGIRSPSTVFAEIGDNVVAGFILGIDQNMPSLTGKGAEAMQKFLEAAREQVSKAQGVVGDAFGNLGDFAKRAFEAKTAQMLDRISAKFDKAIGKWQAYADAATPAEKQLAELDAAEAKRSREKALQDANNQLTAAQAMDEGVAKEQAVADAKEAIRQAELANTRAGLEALAETQRAAREKEAAAHIASLEQQRDRELQNLEERRRQTGEKLDEQLADLQTRLAKHPEEYDKIQKQIIALLNRYGVTYKASGKLLGEAFANGLRAAERDVRNAAKSLAQIVADYLEHHSPAKVGPLSRSDKFLDPLGGMLAKQLLAGRSTLADASAKMAGSVRVGGAGGGVASSGTAGPAAIVAKLDQMMRFLATRDGITVEQHYTTAPDDTFGHAHRTKQAILGVFGGTGPGFSY
jgi:hypothetical protein